MRAVAFVKIKCVCDVYAESPLNTTTWIMIQRLLRVPHKQSASVIQERETRGRVQSARPAQNLVTDFYRILCGSQPLLPPQQLVQTFSSTPKADQPLLFIFFSKSPSTVFLFLPVLLCFTVEAHQHTLLKLHIIPLPTHHSSPLAKS